MKRYLILLVIVGSFFGCSPTQTLWHDRVREGILNDQTNDAHLWEMALEGLQQEDRNSFIACQDDIKNYMATLYDKETPEARAEYVETAIILLRGNLGMTDKKRQVLLNNMADANTNRRLTLDAIDGAESLNKAWAGAGSKIELLLNQVLNRLNNLEKTND